MPIGTVEKVEEDYVIVSIERQDMCGECHACEMLGEVKKCTLKCVNECKSQVGDQVDVDVEQHSFMKATFIMYGLPLIGLILGVGMGYKFSEGIAIVLGLGLMALTFGMIKYGEKHNKYAKMLPTAKKVIE